MSPEDGPTARALMALELIQSRPGIQADRLAEKLGVSDRAARRAVAALRSAGIPIVSERGPFGGYRLGRGLRLPPLTFSSAEALALVMAVLDGHHPASDPSDPVGGALGKIIRALPAPVAAQAEAVRHAAAPAPDPSAARPDPEVTAALVQAAAESKRVRVDYRSEAGREWQADVDPWSIIVRHGRWYLLCWAHTSNARRAYRIDRMTNVRPLPDSFTPPTDLDPVATLEEHLATGWEYQVEVEIEAPTAKVTPCVSPALGHLAPLTPDRCRLVGSTSNPWWYAEQLTALPAAFRVLNGPELRHCVRTLGERLVAAAGVEEQTPEAG